MEETLEAGDAVGQNLVEIETSKNSTEADEPEVTKDIVFYWFLDDPEQHADEIDVRIHIPEKTAFIALNYDSIGEVYESSPYPIALGTHLAQLQVLKSSSENSGERLKSSNTNDLQYTFTQTQLLPFEITPERTRIIVKTDPSMKPIDLPLPRVNNSVTISPKKGEVKWTRADDSPFDTTAAINSLIVDPPNDENYQSSANQKREHRKSENDEDQTLGSIDEILKKFSNISALSLTGIENFESEPTDSYVKLPDVSARSSQSEGKGQKLNGFNEEKKPEEVSSLPDGAKSKANSYFQDKIANLERAKDKQQNEILVLKTKLMEAERNLKEQKELNNQKSARDNRYQMLHDENSRLSEEILRLKTECEKTLTQTTNNKLMSAENSSLAIMKRLEYLESELRESRKMSESLKFELTENAKEVEKLQQDNSRLRKRLEKYESLSGSEKSESRQPIKNVDFGEDTVIHSEISPRSERSQRNLVEKEFRAVANEKEYDNFTSTNLRFLRERLVELRAKNEKLQERYNQVQMTFQESEPRKNGSQIEIKNSGNHREKWAVDSPEDILLEQETLVSIFDETDREIEFMMRNIADSNVIKTDYGDNFYPKLKSNVEDRERDKTLRELEELRNHLSSVRAQVKHRETFNDEAEANRIEAIGKLKKPSELFSSLDWNYEAEKSTKDGGKNRPNSETTPSFRLRTSDYAYPSNSEKRKDLKSGQESDTTEVLLSARSPQQFEDAQEFPALKTTQDESGKMNSRSRSKKFKKSNRRRSSQKKWSSAYSNSSSSSNERSDRQFSPNGFDADAEDALRRSVNPECTILSPKYKPRTNYDSYERKPDRRPNIEENLTSRQQDFSPRGWERKEMNDYDDKDVLTSDIWKLPSNKSTNGLDSTHQRQQRSPTTRNSKSSRPSEKGRPYIPRTPSDIHIGDRLKFSRSGGKISQGIVKYVGTLPSRTDQYLGVELCDAEGKHDGTFQDKRYFNCAKNKGVFVSFKKIVMCYT